MSEEINLEASSNLCTTEDAFEQFQAASIYEEEEEFITLSDIVPPTPAVPDLHADLGEIPFADEIELTPCSDSQLSQINSKSVPDTEQITCPENAVDVEPKVNEEILTQSSRPKRDRKQKLPYPDEDVSLSLDDDSAQGYRKLLAPVRGRRGRKPKIAKTNQDQNDINLPVVLETDTSLSKTPKLTKRGRKKKTVNISSDLKLEEPVKKPLKQYTPKKMTPEEETSALLQTLNGQENISAELSHADDIPAEKSKAKRKKVSTLTDQQKQLPPVDSTATDPKGDTVESALSELFGINNNDATDAKTSEALPKKGRTKRQSSTSTSEQLLENKNNTSDIGVTFTVPKKRGRPRKNVEKKEPADTDKETNKVNASDDDLEDDMSLSTLSQKNFTANLQKEVGEISENVKVDDSQDNADIKTNDLALNKIETTREDDSEDIVVDDSDPLEKPPCSEDDNETKTVDTLAKRSSKVPLKSDFEYNIDNIVKENINENQQQEEGEEADNSLLIEDSSKRPVRRKVKQNTHYEEESDEDPFANIELSDDDEPRGRRKRYCSDDEYVPEFNESKKKRGRKRKSYIDTDSDSEDLDAEDLELPERNSRKRKTCKKLKQDIFPDINVTTISPQINLLQDEDDIEVCLQSSIIKTNEDTSEKLGWSSSGSHAFENFIAKKIQGTNLQIKKVSSNEPLHNTPLEIPVIDPDAKKSVEICTQTNIIETTNTEAQTNTPYEVPMTKNVALTTMQSEKACEFLQNIIKTTSELGQLMTQKSEDFIAKKINTKNVTDTFKMDYCVQKSFLLFKLAKSNLIQMEEDLAKQYEEFLKVNNLSECREELKKVIPSDKVTDNDSDCEIVEETPSPLQKKTFPPKFNPKTVFLNKELSIKIAKKPSAATNKAKACKDKLNLQGKKSVWLSNSVMVKKVNPTQSFLAQDGRNKKPPDCYVTNKMVHDFFEDYYRQQAIKACAPFTSKEWLTIDQNYICAYFFVKSDKFKENTSNFDNFNDNFNHESGEDSDSAEGGISEVAKITVTREISSPASLLSICMKTLQKRLTILNHSRVDSHSQEVSNPFADVTIPESLLRLCLKSISDYSCNTLECCSSIMNVNIEDTFLTEENLNEAHFSISSGSIHENEYIPESLFRLCLNVVTKNFHDIKNDPLSSLQTKCHEPLEDFDEDVMSPFSENSVDSGKIMDYRDLFPGQLNPRVNYTTTHSPQPLKTLCYKTLTDLLFVATEVANNEDVMLFYSDSKEQSNQRHFTETNIEQNYCNKSVHYNFDNIKIIPMRLSSVAKNGIKSLFHLCVKKMQEFLSSSYSKIYVDDDTELKKTMPYYTPKSLKIITLEFICDILCNNADDKLKECHISYKETPELTPVVVYDVKKLATICLETILLLTHYSINKNCVQKTSELTINSVNTLTEEAFHNIENVYDRGCEENSPFAEDGEANFYDEDGFDPIFDEELNAGDIHSETNENNSWATQVQMKELKSCILKVNSQKQTKDDESCGEEEQPIIMQVKLEPLESMEEQNECENPIHPVIVKTEPALPPDEMISIPENIVTKQEFQDDTHARDVLQRYDSSCFDVVAFERFVSTNKLMHPLNEPNDEIFSQSALRIRRQHDPDYINEYDPSMSLLIPQTFEPLNIETAKDKLMESSTDDEARNANKIATKKKHEKRGRPRKKTVEKQSKTHIAEKQSKTQAAEKQSKTQAAEKSKEKPAPLPPLPPLNELAVLTRRMREKIRQEEKKIESSDSENENVPLSVKKSKDKKAGNESVNTPNNKKITDEDIQCNDIDSTEQIETPSDEVIADTDSLKSFTGFSAVDQNAVASYQKYMKFVYDKIMPKDAEVSENKTTSANVSTANECGSDRAESPLINFEDPVEMVECEPTMPIFDENEMRVKVHKKTKAKAVPEAEQSTSNVDVHKNKEFQKKGQINEVPDSEYIERDGWNCYPIAKNETKLYQTPMLILEKLPESFVETYFQYQNISSFHKEDEEVDRLINLNTLGRSTNLKEAKGKPRSKAKNTIESEKNCDTAKAVSPTFSEPLNEFSPSEDEGVNVDDDISMMVTTNQAASENNFAKNSLMNDSDSDNPISKIKDEVIDEDKPIKKKKHKNKTPEKKVEDPENLTLTADKMMKKELHLLHAPVNMNVEVPETSGKGQISHKSKKKSGSKSCSTRDRIKGDDDLSDEEKQWVYTKEKLLKRMEKKQETAIMDDAKRTKLVNEFIVRREEGKGRRNQRLLGRVKGRNSRQRLEREKQLRVLSHELYGEPSHSTKRQGQSLFTGRRNIRKVIDKKSLARSTVIANMEEFERKRRLNQRQTKLRELLGVEEGVNVLVINDEVCLEYDLEMQQPVVTVHSFFTKVMKAHQYEGVKFMWDACFESLASVEAGHPGGGCILAHCMGLGKTLQVLALLHTVLTHPRAGMRRVLVCCPLSTVLNWVDEIHKWITPVTNEIKVFELSKLKKTYERAFQLEDWYTRGGIFIIGYELFRSLSTLDPELDDVRPTIINKIRTALLDPGPDIIVCDEGHLLKNDCSVLAVAMSRVATKRRIVLTGTPMQNNLREYYCMVNFIKPNLLGTYSEYSNRFENPIMNGQHRDSIEADIKLMKERTHILHKVLEGCLQRQEASVLYPYLPSKHEYTLFISLTPVQWDLYKYYVQNYANQNKQCVLKDFHVLQKIWSHPQVLHNFQMKARNQIVNKLATMKPEKLEDDLAQADLAASEDIKPEDVKPGDMDRWWLEYLDGGNMLDSLDSSNKFVVVFRILEECISLGDKVLIFSTSLFTMDSLEYFLKKINKWSLGQEYYRLDGSVPAEVRQKWCREFNAENNHKTKLFLISTRAGSLGLNMVAANRVIILDTSWNPAHDIQSIFRVYRFGQKKDCHIYRLVAMGTMEQKIYERSVSKQAVACRVVDEQQIERHYNMAELTELYRYDESGLGVAGGVAAGVRDVALLRVARLSALHAVHEHDSLLRGSAEPSLPEDERAAAWMQFQEEHAHKQRQNQLTSGHLKRNKPVKTVNDHDYQLPLPEIPESSHLLQYPQLSNLTEIKTDTSTAVPEPKHKKRKKPIKLKISLPPAPQVLEQNKEAKSIQDGMVKKIMDILVSRNQTQNAQEITKLVAKVRKIVAFGQIDQESFEDEVTQTVANVLLGKEPMPPTTVAMPQETAPKPPVSDVKTVKDVKQKRGRGRPRKPVHKTLEETSAEIRHEKSVKICEKKPDAHEEEKIEDGKNRRKAAIVAKKQINSIDDEIVDLDADDDWPGASDNDYTPEQITPKQKTEKPKPKSKKEQHRTVEPEKEQDIVKKELNTEINSILLSDDDDAPVQKSTSKSEKLKATVDAPIPLHPSLLSNKNFIKIIAHTYLEGNSSLDEDAATLAAQYSALKAQKEVETTGKPIDSGPIYDIAFKVLGPDIIAKLYKTNSKTVTKCEPSISRIRNDSQDKPIAKLKAKTIAELTGKTKPPTPQKDIIPESPQIKAQVPQAKVKKSKTNPGFAKIMATGVAMSAAGSSETTASPTVVPIGMFARAHSIAETTQISTQPKEESILPDDDVIISDNLTPTISDNLAPKNKHLLPVNKVTSQGPPIPKIKISKGKIVLSPSLVIPPANTTVQKPSVVSDTASDTICLDSDEEETITPTVQPTSNARKLVAVKSTAKQQQPVPVQLTAANPINPGQPQIIPESIPTLQTGVINLGKSQNANFVVIPASHASKLTKLPQGSIPPNVNISRLFVGSQNTAVPMQIPNNVNLLNPHLDGLLSSKSVIMNQMPQNLNFVNQIPQNLNMLNQNLNVGPQASSFTLQPQNINIVGTIPTKVITAPQIISSPIGTINLGSISTTGTSTQNVSSSESILPTLPSKTLSKPGPASSKARNKTLCKPGDILRITKTGQVEILNRDDNDAAVGQLKATTSKKQTNDPQTSVSLSDDEEPERVSSKFSKVESKTKKTKRSRKISSSSSSSDNSSRPSSPNDPLSILKDVVHIQASEDPFPVENTPTKSNLRPEKVVGSTSTKKSASSTPSKATRSQNDPMPKVSQAKKDKILDQINKTNTVLMKLNDVFGPATEGKGKNQNIGKIDSVDLTDATPSTSSVLDKLSRDIKIGKASNNTPTKIVGTSKNIILTGSGKATVASVENQAKKSIRVTNVEIMPATPAFKSWTVAKKRSSTASTSAAKKKKTGSALDDLRFFNCDDENDNSNIDMNIDIIELE
ncbi:uncharacterized protein LOC113230919 [Hyposmocoma kahamanoa]|uniref:uncharacterized protein LOC113230919 n=1 Tax=Hyposmocoma kahamanoa TaxID=1477025 RepID=UPI000E6D90BA|nr:uncharacterized protein LOC113230919 [Hyposmocoma kahamanoa]